jgi:hypothetical protein
MWTYQYPRGSPNNVSVLSTLSFHNTYITAVTLVVHTTRQFNIFVRNGIRITPNVNRHTSNGRQEDLNIGSCNKLGVHAIGHAKDGLPEIGFGRLEAPGNLGHVPDGFNRRFGHDRLSRRHENLAVRNESTIRNGLAAFRQINVRFRHGNRRSNVPALFQPLIVHTCCHVPERIHGGHFLGITPGRVGTNLEDWRREFKVGQIVRIQLSRRNRQARVHAVRSLMRPDGVALRRVAHGANDGAADGWIRVAPFDGDRVDAERVRVRRQANGLVGLRDFGDWNAIVFCSMNVSCD